MYRTLEEIIDHHKQVESQGLSDVKSALGDYCDALRGFLEIAGEWKTAADEAFNLNVADSRTNFFKARSLSLNILTTRTISVARDVPRVLLSGASIPTVLTWRYVSEAKNIALLIDLDIAGKAGFLWLHYKAIEQAKVDPNSKESQSVRELSKRVLTEAGLPYDRKAKDQWAIGIDGKIKANAIDRSEYIWEYRKFPPEVDERKRSYLANAEQKMIRLSNAFAHPTLTPWDALNGNFHAMMLSTPLDVMAVMLAYKAAASDAAGWPYRETVSEQFHLYPEQNQEAGILSLMVKETYEHCLAVFENQFGLQDC